MFALTSVDASELGGVIIRGGSVPNIRVPDNGVITVDGAEAIQLFMAGAKLTAGLIVDKEVEPWKAPTQEELEAEEKEREENRQKGQEAYDKEMERRQQQFPQQYPPGVPDRRQVERSQAAGTVPQASAPTQAQQQAQAQHQQQTQHQQNQPERK